MIRLGSHSVHLDNGGPSIDVLLTDSKNLQIQLNASYFGFPSVSAELTYWINSALNNETKSNADLLREIGQMFLSAADKAEVHEQSNSNNQS